MIDLAPDFGDSREVRRGDHAKIDQSDDAVETGQEFCRRFLTQLTPLVPSFSRALPPNCATTTRIVIKTRVQINEPWLHTAQQPDDKTTAFSTLVPN